MPFEFYLRDIYMSFNEKTLRKDNDVPDYSESNPTLAAFIALCMEQTQSLEKLINANIELHPDLPETTVQLMRATVVHINLQQTVIVHLGEENMKNFDYLTSTLERLQK